MKNITFSLVIILTFTFYTQNVKSQEYQLDSVQVFKWDDPILPDDWLMQQREHYSYTNGGTDFSSMIIMLKDNNTPFTWLNNFQRIRTFNDQDKIESEIFQGWSGTDWINSSKWENSYDGSGNNDLTTYYGHNGSDWFIAGQDINTYTTNNLIETSKNQMWDGMQFINISQVTSSYTNDLLTQENTYDWDLTAMPPDWKTDPTFRITYTYTGNLIKDYLTQRDTGSGLENQSFVENTYDGENLDEIISSNWDSDKNEFIGAFRQVLSYDMNNLITELISYYLLAESFWIQQNRLIPFFSDASLSTITNSISEDKIFPNPFKKEFNIVFQSTLKSKGVLQIFDTHGKKLSEIKLNRGVKRLQVQSPSLSRGIYFVKIINDNKHQSFKIIKE